MRGEKDRAKITRRLKLLKKIFEDTKPTAETLNGCLEAITDEKANLILSSSDS